MESDTPSIKLQLKVNMHSQYNRQSLLLSIDQIVHIQQKDFAQLHRHKTNRQTDFAYVGFEIFPLLAMQQINVLW